jgi:hypothetical protein
MWAVQGKAELPLFVAIPFFLLIIVLLSLYGFFAKHIAPKVLDLWAKEHGHKVVQKKDAGIFRRLSVGASNTQVVYEIVLIDKWGVTRSGLVKIGWYGLPKLSSVNCPIEDYLDKAKYPGDWPEL